MDNFNYTHDITLSTSQLERLNYKDPSWMAVYRLLCLYNQFPDPYKIIKQIDHCQYFQKIITPDNMTSVLSVYGFRVLYCQNIDFSIAKKGTYGLIYYRSKQKNRRPTYTLFYKGPYIMDWSFYINPLSDAPEIMSFETFINENSFKKKFLCLCVQKGE